MNHAYILWIAAFAYALHVVEEYTFDWKGWAANVLKLPVTWVHFAIVNGVVVVLVLSFIIGALLMASPIVMLKLRLHPYFKQDK